MMQVQFGLTNFAPEWERSVVCIGTFDGVHLGHQEVIRTAVDASRERRLPCCLITFDRHPAATLNPERCPPEILSLGSRLSKFEELGVSLSVVLPFDELFRETPAEVFLSEVLMRHFKADELVVGHDFALGKDRRGDTTWLQQNFATHVVPAYEHLGLRVSSSAIRKAVAEGDLVTAETLLGHPFMISGVVVSGDRLGRQLGYPTANLARSYRQVTPADGVYAGTLSLDNSSYKTAVSIGTRPSVGGLDRRIEAYCLDYKGEEFYGRMCSVDLHKLIRKQESFDSMDRLVKQISEDVEAVREYESRREISPSKIA